MENITTIILAIFASVMASGGFWTYLQGNRDKKDNTKAIVIGLAHDRLMHLGMIYIERGKITEDEYENYVHWLYEPYDNLKIYNGAVKRIKQEVDKLPIFRAGINLGSKIENAKANFERSKV